MMGESVSGSSNLSASDDVTVIKITRSHITVEQKEYMLAFITENPEIVTHSSTKENERELWKELVEKLNKLKPEKGVDNWKNFWQRWQISVTSKPETALTSLDSRLKKFLIKIKTGSENAEGGVTFDHPPVNSNIDDTIKQLEIEKAKLQLQIDENDYKILKYKKAVSYYEEENFHKRKRMQQVHSRRQYLLLKKKQQSMKSEVSDCNSSEFKLKKRIKIEPPSED